MAFDENGNVLGGVGGSFDVVESLSGDVGTYNVANNITGAGRASILGFGVSNNGTIPTVEGSNFGSANATNNPDYANICYEAVAITADDWDNEAPEFFDGSYTFANVFGDFATVAGGDSVFNYFYAVDGDLGAGGSINDFFGFLGLNVASNIIGAFDNGGSVGYFTAGSAVPPGGPGPNTPAVPLPAAGWMLIAGLGGLAAMGRRKRA